MSETLGLYRPVSKESEAQLRAAVASVADIQPGTSNYMRIALLGKRAVKDGTLDMLLDKLPDSAHRSLDVDVRGVSIFDLKNNIPTIVMLLSGQESKTLLHEQLEARRITRMKGVGVTHHPVIDLAKMTRQSSLDSLRQLTHALPETISLDPAVYSHNNQSLSIIE